MPGPIRVVVADDHPLLVDGLLAMLSDAEHIRVAGVAYDGDRAVELVRQEEPDVAVLDVRMPGCDGIEATRRIRAGHPSVRVVVISAADDVSMAAEAFRAGASAFLGKKVDPRFLLQTIESVAGGKVVMEADIGARLADRTGSPFDGGPLSEPDRELLRMVADGSTNDQIAKSVGMSVATVKARLSAVFVRIGAKDRASAVAISLRRGWMA